MPRYYFDTSDGEAALIDTEGHELTNDAEARLTALDVLPDMARDIIPDGDRRTFISAVRNAAGKVIYSASLSLVGHWQMDDGETLQEASAAPCVQLKPAAGR